MNITPNNSPYIASQNGTSWNTGATAQTAAKYMDVQYAGVEFKFTFSAGEVASREKLIEKLESYREKLAQCMRREGLTVIDAPESHPGIDGIVYTSDDQKVSSGVIRIYTSDMKGSGNDKRSVSSRMILAHKSFMMQFG